MPKIVAEPPSRRCSPAALGTPVQEYQRLGPDLCSRTLRDARGRFAKGSSGNPRGRPPGIRNPRRRVPDLRARPLSAKALSDLIDRKPRLLRPLARYKRRRTSRPLSARIQPVCGTTRPDSRRAPKTGYARERRPLPIGIRKRRNVNEPIAARRTCGNSRIHLMRLSNFTSQTLDFLCRN